MSNIQCVCEHSVDLSLLKRDSKVLDLGMRYGGWTLNMLQYVDHMYAVDADSDIECTLKEISYLNAAIGPKAAIQPFVKFGNGTGNFLHTNEPLPRQCTIEDVHVFTLEDISDYFQVQFWDLIKFDVEGEESEILHDLKEPIATQISWEGHQHTVKKKPDSYIQEIYSNLERIGYKIVVKDYSDRHGCGFNYWDSLAILK